MPKTITIDIDKFRKGYQLYDDDSFAPIGSAREMLNVLISDRGGIQNRPGTELLGTYNTSPYGCKGFFNFIKSLGSSELLLKSYDDELEVYHPVCGWYKLKDSFTQDKEFGFVSSLVNTENEDFVYFSNRYEDYQRWQGAVTLLNGALVGAETAITVDSTLKTDIFASTTATSSAATTLTDSTVTWASSQWVNFYVYITNGALSGKVRKITSNTSDTLTFDTLGSDPGSCTFEIKQLAFPATGTLIYNGTNIAYTAVDTATTFTVSSAHAADDNTPITLIPTAYPANPRGNRMDSLMGRIMVGNVRSALSRDSGGALQGSSSAGSVFVSKLNNPTDFTYSATRVAGEGDIISTPYGGGDITDVKAQEDAAYIFKKAYIESIKYSQDANDLAVRVPLKPGVGSASKVIKGKDDMYFITEDKQFTSLGRVENKDLTVQTENLGLIIKRYLDSTVTDNFNGIEFDNRILFTLKSGSDFDKNNVVILYNKTTKSFEGIWNMPAYGFEVYGNDLYYAQSNGANVFKMFTGKSDVQGTSKLPVTSRWQSNFMNLLPIKANIQGLNSLAVEGHITANTTLTFKLFKDFSKNSSLSFDFGGDEEAFLTGTNIGAFFGKNPLGLNPVGTIDSIGEDGTRRFSFIIYFPQQYAQYFSFGFESSGVDQKWEILRVSLGLKESVAVKRINTKSL